ncbi:MAG: hypothetical protein ACRDZO_10105 [Egibacteraceae bacterium]
MSEQTTSFDLRGLVGIQVVGATPAEAAAVRRQLGPLERPLDREPDIVIRYCDQIPVTAPVRLIGVDEIGFTDDCFLVLRGKREARVRVAIPMDQVGGRCEILCERGALGVPLLIPIVNLTALTRGILPLHAAAFVYQGRGVLVTGWAKGGKTETLLAFMSHGARYAGDEWIYIDPATRRLVGIPEPIRLWDWHLRSAVEYRAAVPAKARARLAALRGGVSALEALAGTQALAGAQALARRALPIVRRQLNVQVTPTKLFGAGACVDEATLDHVLLVANHASATIEAEPVPASEVADRMAYSLEYERLDFRSYYQRFRFAFPRAANPHLDEAETTERQLLHKALDGVPSHAVRHPYPVAIPALFDAISPLLGTA